MASPKKSSFQRLIDAEIPVVLDFHATWCGPCHAFAPVLDQLKADLGEAVRVVKIDIDRNAALSSALGVQSVPTVMIYQGGNLKWRATGGQTLATLRGQLDLINR